MDNWLKWGLGGAAGLGLMALSGGTAAGPLSALFGSGGAAAGTAGTAAAAGTTGAAASTGALLGGEAAATGSLLYPGTASAASASGLGTIPAAQSMMFSTPSVTGGPLSGALAGTTLDYGTPAMLAEASTAAAAQPGLLAQAAAAGKTGMKAFGTYGAVNNALGGNRPPPMAPAGGPMFQGQAAPIAPQGGAQPAPNQNAVLAAIARRRQRGF